MVQFSDETLRRFQATVAQYPEKQAALLPALWLAQEEFGYLSPESMEYVAGLLSLPPAHVYAVRVVLYHVPAQARGQVPGAGVPDAPSALSGAEGLTGHLCRRLGIGVGETTRI